MITKLATKIFGSRNERIVKGLRKQVAKINELEAGLQGLSDQELQGKTTEFRQRLEQGEKLDDLLPEAFAVVREAGVRALGMRHYDVQMIGGMILHQNKITEMRTGEGKTLMATLPAYLNALTGSGVHIITVNDYLAERDANWMSQLYAFLGLTTGVVLSTKNYDEKREAYAADITYGTNNQFGFDYMHDNLSLSLAERVQRGLNFAIVDEVDSILIDEARTPLIISGPSSDSSDLYGRINKYIPRLQKVQEEDGPGDYTVDEKSKQAYLTEEGHETIEQMLIEDGLLTIGESLYDSNNIALLHHLTAALRAHALFQKDVDYLVQNDQILIVDEFTGRTMPGRRWSEGLHQAIEAKEGVSIQNENQTVASITFQNYFRLYNKLAGMTGTADTEAYEFQQIYGLEVVVVPTHKPMIRKDMGDLVYLTAEEKFEAIIADIESCRERQQPVLVGTTSVEVSEYLSQKLKKKGISHEVLNAKQHEREALIVAEAGKPGAVTIATNMAGRGTDIVLGGNLDVELESLDGDVSESQKEERKQAWKQRHQQVLDAGGLHIIGTERHESRRVDNQLRGRSGRQGDPGSTRFYLALDDSLMRIFASDRVANLMQKLGMEQGEAIEHPWVTKAIENAQRKVEAHNFDMRKHLLEYDDVANDQRKVIYQQRSDLLQADDIRESVAAMREEVITQMFRAHLPDGSVEEQWDLDGLEKQLSAEFATPLPVKQWLEKDPELHDETLLERIQSEFAEQYQRKVDHVGEETAKRFEKEVMLMVVDRFWKEHLAAMDYLRQSIGLRGYAQKNPIQEFKRESYDMFSTMLEQIKFEVVSFLSRVQVQEPEQAQIVQTAIPESAMQMQHENAESALAAQPPVASANQPDQSESQQPYVRDGKKLGRNEPCWCGSGKKFKQCHGKL